MFPRTIKKRRKGYSLDTEVGLRRHAELQQHRPDDLFIENRFRSLILELSKHGRDPHRVELLSLYLWKEGGTFTES